MVGVLFAEVDRLIDRRRGRNFVQQQNLIGSQAQDIQHHRLQVLEPTGQNLLEIVVQQHPVLQDAIAQAAGQRRIAPVQFIAGQVFFQNAV